MDEFTPAYRTLVVATKSRSRFWDGDAVRVPLADSPGNRYPRPPSAHARNTGKGKGYGDAPVAPVDYSVGAPLLDFWIIDDEGEPDMTTRLLIADVFDGLATLEPGSVDLIVTSPPFLALRSYLPADHPDKAKEMGSEATPGEFLDALLDVTEACARVLAPHGSLVFELGDTYSGLGGATDGTEGDGTKYERTVYDGFVDSRPGAPRGIAKRYTRSRGKVAGWPLDKSKVLIPQLFAIALAYGFNPLTGRQTEPWRVRNTVAWCRPNPPVGRDGDKFRPATSFLTVACKARDRYWDGDAVRTPVQHPNQKATGRAGTRESKGNSDGVSGQGLGDYDGTMSAGAPLLDYWVIPTHPYPGAHYATYPPDLVVPLVKAMCPRKVCRVCGEPSRRIVGEAEYLATHNGAVTDGDEAWRHGRRGLDPANGQNTNESMTRNAPTLGWSDCGHDDWRAGMVLDPFVGSGTTLAVASGHGLDSIGIDLDARNAELARERVGGLFLEVCAFGEVS